jgi:hypothetical protein
VPTVDTAALALERDSLAATLAASQVEVAKLQGEVATRDATIAARDRDAKVAAVALADRDRVVAERDAARKAVADRDATIASHVATITDRDTTIAGLRRELDVATARGGGGGAGGAGEVPVDHAPMYTMGDRLGEGMFGVVNRAVTTPAAAAVGLKAGVAVALKVMAAPTSEEQARKLKREMTTLEKVWQGGGGGS